MKNSVRFFLALALVSGTVAKADGFKCEGDDSTLNVKVFNHVHADLGTRTPAKLIISDLNQGTLAVRSGSEIRKSNLASKVQYVVDGSRKLGAETAILQVQYKQGRETIAAGEVRPGHLILVDAEGERTVYDLSCERYVKHQ